MASDERDWVVAPDEARIDIAIGPEAKLTPEVRESLEALMQALAQEDEVGGYLLGGTLSATCTTVADCHMVTLCAFVVKCSVVVMCSNKTAA